MCLQCPPVRPVAVVCGFIHAVSLSACSSAECSQSCAPLCTSPARLSHYLYSAAASSAGIDPNDTAFTRAKNAGRAALPLNQGGGGTGHHGLSVLVDCRDGQICVEMTDLFTNRFHPRVANQRSQATPVDEPHAVLRQATITNPIVRSFRWHPC